MIAKLIKLGDEFLKVILCKRKRNTQKENFPPKPKNGGEEKNSIVLQGLKDDELQQVKEKIRGLYGVSSQMRNVEEKYSFSSGKPKTLSPCLKIILQDNTINYIEEYIKLIMQQLTWQNIKVAGIISVCVYIVCLNGRLEDKTKIIGELVERNRSQKLQIDNHLQAIAQTIEQKEKVINQQKIEIGLYQAALMIMFFILSYVFYLNLKNIIFKLLKERKKQRLDNQRGLKYLEISNFECQICYERPRNIILKPCKHMTLCHVCLQRLETQKCPVCMTRIEDYIEVFIT